MILEKQDVSTLETSEDFKSYQFGVTQAGLSHVFNVLRNSMYSDKILAVIREYSANSVDAHVEAGIPDKSVVVSLPNALSPQFRVRDFGLGLSEEQIRDVYCNYGESTKRNSNNLIGQLGLGSKAGFAYGDNFMIISYQKGKQTVYNAFIDPSEIGQISKMNTSDTEEQDGIEIVVPVKQWDFGTFRQKAGNLFRYFKIKPIIKGLNAYEKEEFDKLMNPSETLLLAEDNWKIRQGASVAVMGNIGYPINSNAIQNLDPSALRLLNFGIEINFRIGDLDIAASREALQYSDKTQKAIKKILESAWTKTKDYLQNDFKTCQNILEARRKYRDMHNGGSPFYNFKDLIQNITWNGQTITSHFFDIRSQRGSGTLVGNCLSVTSYGLDYKEKISNYEVDSFDSREDSKYVIDDLQGKNFKNRARTLLKDSSNVYLFKFKDDAGKDAALKAWGLDTIPNLFVLASSIIPTKPVKVPGSKNAKHSRKEFVFDTTVSGRYESNSSFWKVEEVDFEEDEGVYVELERFKFFMNGVSYKSHELGELIETLASIKITVPTVYGFKALAATDNNIKTNPNWESLYDFIKREISALIIKDNIAQQFLDRATAKKHEFLFDTLGSDLLKNLPPNSEAYKYIAAYGDMLNKADENRIEEILYVANKVGISDITSLKTASAPTYNLDKLREDLYAKYPLLPHLDTDFTKWCGNATAKNAKILADYLK
jgi:hypothetical protein